MFKEQYPSTEANDTYALEALKDFLVAHPDQDGDWVWFNPSGETVRVLWARGKTYMDERWDVFARRADSDGKVARLSWRWFDGETRMVAFHPPGQSVRRLPGYTQERSRRRKLLLHDMKFSFAASIAVLFSGVGMIGAANFLSALSKPQPVQKRFFIDNGEMPEQFLDMQKRLTDMQTR